MSDQGDGRKLGSPWVYYQYQVHKTPNFFATDANTYRIFSNWFFDQVIYTLSAEAGSFVLTGTDATLLRPQYIFTVESGTFAFTGTDATLIFYPVSDYTLDADAGTITLTGSAVTLEAYYPITASAGEITLTGSDVGLLRNYILSVEGASYTFTGSAITLTFTRAVIAGVGTFTLTGEAATFYKWLYSSLSETEILFELEMSANERALTGTMRALFTITASDASSFETSILFACTAEGYDSSIHCTLSGSLKMSIDAEAFAGVLGWLEDKMDKMNIDAFAYTLSVGQLDQDVTFIADIIASQSERYSGYVMEYIR
jgi:hypothetical protein